MKFYSCLLVSCIVWVAGCATPVQELDSSTLQQVQKGQTRASVQQVFGKPPITRSGNNGKVVDTYYASQLVYSKSSASDRVRDLRIRSLSIRYSKAETVEETLFNESRTEAQLLPHSAYGGPNLPPEDVAKIHIGVTTREELERLFGKPMLVSLHPNGGVSLHWFQIELGTSFINPDSTKGLHVLLDLSGTVRDFGQTDRGQERR